MTTSQKSGCAGWLAALFGDQPKSSAAVDERAPDAAEPLPYRLTKNFLSPAEISFYHVLRQAVGPAAAICAKVSLGDLFYPKTKKRSAYQTYRNKIDRKHVDFLLCDPQTMQPLVGIELDDGSHRQPARQERDEFVEAVFAAAGLPLYRQPAQHSYSVTQVTAALQPYVSLPASAAPPEVSDNGKPALHAATPATAAEPEAVAPPACPQCGQAMVLRTVRKAGPNYGQQFWGCPDFPTCRGMRPLEEKG